MSMTTNPNQLATKLIQFLSIFFSFFVAFSANCSVKCYESVTELRANDKYRNVTSDEIDIGLADINYLERKFAVVVGVDNYFPPINPLNNAVTDAESISEVLDSKLSGFEVICLKNINRDEFKIFYYFLDNLLNNRKLIRQNFVVGQQEKNEVDFIFYFAGHGFSSNGNNFMVFSNKNDFPNERASSLENTLKNNSESLHSIFSLLNKDSLFQPIIFFDACRNAFDLHDDAGMSSTPFTLEDNDKVFTVYSTSSNSPASDGQGDSNGPFAKVFKNVFSGRKVAILEYPTLIQHIDRLVERINSAQKPVFLNKNLHGSARFTQPAKINPFPYCNQLEKIMAIESVSFVNLCGGAELILQACQSESSSFLDSNWDPDDCPMPWGQPYASCNLSVRQAFFRICEKSENSLNLPILKNFETQQLLTEIPIGQTAFSNRKNNNTWTIDERIALVSKNGVKIFSDQKLKKTISTIEYGNTVFLDNPNNIDLKRKSIPIYFYNGQDFQNGFIKSTNIKRANNEFSFSLSSLSISEDNLSRLYSWVSSLNTTKASSTIRITTTRSSISASPNDLSLLRSEAYVYSVYVKSLLESLGISNDAILIEYDATSSVHDSSEAKIVLSCIRLCSAE